WPGRNRPSRRGHRPFSGPPGIGIAGDPGRSEVIPPRVRTVHRTPTLPADELAIDERRAAAVRNHIATWPAHGGYRTDLAGTALAIASARVGRGVAVTTLYRSDAAAGTVTSGIG